MKGYFNARLHFIICKSRYPILDDVDAQGEAGEEDAGPSLPDTISPGVGLWIVLNAASAMVPAIEQSIRKLLIKAGFTNDECKVSSLYEQGLTLM